MLSRSPSSRTLPRWTRSGAGRPPSGRSLKHPLISYDSAGLGEDTRLMQKLGVSFDEGLESVFGHVGDQIVEHAALAEQGMGAGLDGVGFEVAVHAEALA